MKSKPIPRLTYKSLLELQLYWFRSLGVSVPRGMFYEDLRSTIEILRAKKDA